MDILLTVSFIILVITLLIIIGFAITWIVGKIVKRNGPKKTGKIGIFITLPIMLVSLIATGISGYKIQVQQAESEQIVKSENHKFNISARQFSNKYITAGSNMEDIGTNEYKSWGDEIDNSSDSDNFDVDTVVANIVSDNSDKISSADDDMIYLKKRIVTMKDNNNGKYDYSGYEKAYNRINKFYKFVSYPTGSYSEFSDTMTKLDNNVSDSYEWMNE